MSKAAAARAKLAELRALKESGGKRNYVIQEADDLYEEVDEDGYKKVVRDRLNQDDFVIDDNGEGYADDGREEWDRQPGYGSESEEDLPVKGKSGKAGKSWKPQVLSQCSYTQPKRNEKKRSRKRRVPIEALAITLPRVQ